MEQGNSSQRQAKEYLSTIAKDFRLCEKLLGLEKTTGGCFGYRLEKCKGACLREEKAIFYNLRLLEALHAVKVKPWPFDGGIMIEEKNELSGKQEYFFVDKWCYFGTAQDEQTDVEKLRGTSLEFDLDIYKILRRYLLNPANMPKIKQVPSTYTKHMSDLPMGVQF